MRWPGPSWKREAREARLPPFLRTSLAARAERLKLARQRAQYIPGWLPARTARRVDSRRTLQKGERPADFPAWPRAQSARRDREQGPDGRTDKASPERD